MKTYHKSIVFVTILATTSLAKPTVDCDRDFRKLQDGCSYVAVEGSSWQVAGCCERNINLPNSRCANLQKRQHVKTCPDGSSAVWLYTFDWYPTPSSCVTGGCVH